MEDTNRVPQNEISLELVHIKKDYYVDKKPFTAIKDLSCCFPKKGFVAILGHSGSGKTTLLNIIGGLDQYTEGDLLIDGKSTKGFADKDWDAYRNKRVGFVFQTYNLIPHLNLLQNVELSLQLGGISSKERGERARVVLEKVGLGEYIKKKPNQLSGGQMQRVAIARALVNSPDIILADEPTGALDSTTSVQVMDLIREIGKDRLVILVTHNEELAEEYADRIIRMKDGEIVSDTNPLVSENKEIVQKEVGKKTSMSFFTALRSSAQNVRTKKGRTALTAIACSFGIIGVALVLATSNGFTNYIGGVETSIASSVPITISPTSYQINTSILTEESPIYPTDNQVHVYNPSSSLYVSHRNDYDQTYLNYLNRIMDDPTCPAYGSAMSILYNRQGLDFHFLTQDGNYENKVIHVNQYSSAGMTGSAISSITGLPSTVIHELFGEQKDLSSLYDVIYGKFPTQKDELVLILDRYNRIDFSTMKKLGFYGSDVDYRTLSASDLSVSFDSILYSGEGDTDYRTFKCYANKDYYRLTTKEDLEARLYTTQRDTYDIEVTTNASGEFTMNGTPTTKTIRAIQGPSSYKEVYDNDATYHPIQCKIVGVLRPTESSYLNLMPSSLGYTTELKDYMTADYEYGSVTYELGQIQANNWFVYRDDSGEDGLYRITKAMESLASMAQQMEDAGSEIDISAATSLLSTFASLVDGSIRYYSAVGYDGGTGMSYTTSNSSFLGSCLNMGQELNVDMINTDSLTDLAASIINSGGFFSTEGLPNIVDMMAYFNSYSLITSILIFPKSLTTKDALRAYLDAWNNDHSEQNIVYSDVMSDFTDSLGIMIQVISAVLIVFASISLVVSSVMTAIITYVSVIERTKEIGVLRACGARKKDVGRLFEAECVIIGFFSGLIGIVFTIIACFPINAILDHQFPGNNLSSIAQLHPLHALLLMLLSIGLAFLSGFIPSRIAARKDPVECLRSE